MGPATLVSILMLAVSPARGTESECLSVWVNESQPPQCSAIDIRKELLRRSDLCHAPNAEAAVLRVTVTDCLEGPKASLPAPTAALVERVIQAQVTEAKATKALTARDKTSWEGAVSDLHDAILAWHRQQAVRH